MQPARFHHNVAELKHEMRAFDIQADLRVELLLLRIERVIYRVERFKRSGPLVRTPPGGCFQLERRRPHE